VLHAPCGLILSLEQTYGDQLSGIALGPLAGGSTTAIGLSASDQLWVICDARLPALLRCSLELWRRLLILLRIDGGPTQAAFVDREAQVVPEISMSSTPSVVLLVTWPPAEPELLVDNVHNRKLCALLLLLNLSFACGPLPGQTTEPKPKRILLGWFPLRGG
jgi:hypothetical protein